MQAVILAAGLGARLGDLKRGLPKGFLHIDELNESLIVRSLRLLKEAEIRDIIIGTGFESSAYEKLARDVSEPNFHIKTHKNEKFASTGSAYTLHCVRECITQDFLLLESDLLYEAGALHALLNDTRKDLILASHATYSGDEVFMCVKGGRMQDLSKDRSKLDSIDCELVGISKLSLQTFRTLDCLRENDYEYLLRGFELLLPHSLVWCEIDCAEHLERAKRLVIPEILRENKL